MTIQKLLSQLLILILLSSSIYLGQDDQLKVKTVKSVDLKRYTGTWYEIAKIPNSFQDHCYKNTTAAYSLNEDGTITVINKCIEDDGDEDDAEGVAQVVDTLSNSKLKVSFVSLFGINLFWGDYWIIGLEDNYNYVIVGTPNRKYGWILARTPQISDEDHKKCEEILIRNGYDPGEFVLSLHEN